MSHTDTKAILTLQGICPQHRQTPDNTMDNTMALSE